MLFVFGCIISLISIIYLIYTLIDNRFEVKLIVFYAFGVCCFLAHNSLMDERTEMVHEIEYYEKVNKDIEEYLTSYGNDFDVIDSEDELKINNFIALKCNEYERNAKRITELKQKIKEYERYIWQ